MSFLRVSGESGESQRGNNLSGDNMKKIFVLLLVVGSLFAVDKKWSDSFPQKDLNGKAIIYDKQVYLVDVWATWCPPCRLTIPELIALQEEITKNFTVLGLSVDQESAEYVADFVKKEKVNYPVALAGEALRTLPAVRGIPTMFVLDKNGKIVKTFVGYTDRKTLSLAVKKVLEAHEIH